MALHVFSSKNAHQIETSPGNWTTLTTAQAAAYAADGCTRASGRPSIVLTSGLAEALEAASAFLTSWGDKLPVLCLNRIDPKHFATLQKDFSAVARTTLAIKTPADVGAVAKELAGAFPLAVPAQVSVAPDVPLEEVLETLGKALEPAKKKNEARTTAKADLDEAVRLVSKFEKPVLVLGAGAAQTLEPERALALSTQLDAPVLLTSAATTMPGENLAAYRKAFEGKGALIPAGNMVWVKALASSDGVLALGTSLSEVDWFGFKSIKVSRAPIVRVGLERVQRELARLFVCADAESFVEALLEKTPKKPGRRIGGWQKQCANWQQKVASEAEKCAGLSYIEPRLAAHRIVTGAPENTVFISEGGSCGMWLWSYLWMQRLVFPVQNGTIGVPIPMAAGVGAADPEAPVWSVVGDGAFYYNAAELKTLAKSKKPAVFFVFNDSSWSAIRLGQTFMFGGRYIGTDLPQSDYAKTAELYGCEGISAAKPGELDKAVAYAASRKEKRPLVVDIHLKKDHVPYAGINFVLAELDGVIPNLALQSLPGSLKAVTSGALTWKTLRSIMEVSR